MFYHLGLSWGGGQVLHWTTSYSDEFIVCHPVMGKETPLNVIHTVTPPVIGSTVL